MDAAATEVVNIVFWWIKSWRVIFINPARPLGDECTRGLPADGSTIWLCDAYLIMNKLSASNPISDLIIISAGVVDQLDLAVTPVPFGSSCGEKSTPSLGSGARDRS